MKRIIILNLGIVLLWGILIEAKYAQPQASGSNCREGFEKREINDGIFSLLGVQLNAKKRITQSDKMLYLYTSTPAKSKQYFRLEFWEPDSNYWVRCQVSTGNLIQHQYPTTNVRDTEKIKLDQFYPLNRNSTGSVYFPSLITNQTSPPEFKKYQFIFQTAGELELNMFIVRVKKNHPYEVIFKQKVMEEFVGELILYWNGKDQNGTSVDTGNYHLIIDGIMYLSRRKPKIKEDIVFYHNQDILK